MSRSERAAGAAPIWGGGAAALCAVILVAGVAASRDEATTRALEVEIIEGQATATESPSAGSVSIASASASPSTSASGPPSKPLMPAGNRAPVNLLGAGRTVAELRVISKDFPRDPEVLLAILRAHKGSGAPMTKEIFGDAQRVLELDATLATHADVLAALDASASVKHVGDGKAVSDGALQILSTASKSPGFDLLLRIASGTSPARQRALELTKDPQVQANASKASLVLVQLRDASPCGRAAHLEAAAADADARALPLLTPMMAKKGCGFLSLSDCYSCMGTRAELTKAINEITKRK